MYNHYDKRMCCKLGTAIGWRKKAEYSGHAVYRETATSTGTNHRACTCCMANFRNTNLEPSARDQYRDHTVTHYRSNGQCNSNIMLWHQSSWDNLTEADLHHHRVHTGNSNKTVTDCQTWSWNSFSFMCLRINMHFHIALFHLRCRFKLGSMSGTAKSVSLKAFA